MRKFRCAKCRDEGWRYDDDPALDFGGPSDYEIACECIKHKPLAEQRRIVQAARDHKRECGR